MTTREVTVTIGFRGTEEYRTRLQQAALDRGLKVQGLIEEALNSYVFGEGSSDSLSAKDLAMGKKFVAWVKRSRTLGVDETDRKLAEFILKEIGA